MRTQMQIPARFETSQVPAINRSSGDSLADSQNGKMLNAEINWTAQSSLSDSFMDLGAHTDCRGSAEGGHDYPVSYPKSVLARSVLESCTSIGLTARGLTAFGSLGVSPSAGALGRLGPVGYVKKERLRFLKAALKLSLIHRPTGQKQTKAPPDVPPESRCSRMLPIGRLRSRGYPSCRLRRCSCL